MESKFSENVKALRKKQRITQEQLAEAMGVTVGAVYKWEQNLSTPDIRIIMTLAHFFGVSVDALVGYEVQDVAAETYAKRIETLRQNKDYPAAAREAEQALVRYPNNFSVVYNCGKLYEVKGIESTENSIDKDLEHAVALFQKAEWLLFQNSDPEISTFTIEAEIAQCRLAQGKIEEALEILKKTNINGIHNAKIGQIYACTKTYSAEKAAPFLTSALMDGLSTQLNTMMGYVNYYDRKEDPESELDVVRWLLSYLKSLKPDEGVSYVDKLIAPLYAEQARLLHILKKPEEAEQSLQKAFHLAIIFDAAPTYQTGSIRFCIADSETVYDDVGPTCISAIEEQMEREQFSDALRTIWERLKAEA